jgi:putative PIN family toxin of toxin-antitoxin system
MHALTVAQQRGKLIFSEETKAELLQVVAREKFEKYLSFDLRLESVLSILNQSQLTQISQTCEIECDIKFLRLALNAQANCIVSGDVHLKELNPFHDIPVLNPSSFLEWVLKQRSN